MPLLNKNSLVFILAFFISIPAGANAGGGEAKEGEGAPAPTANKEAAEYSKKEAKMNSLRTRIDEADERFKHIVHEKNSSKNEETQRHLAAELATIAKERNNLVKEYTELRQDVLYRYPNKGKEIEKNFGARERKSAEELEYSSGLDSQLTEVKKRIDKKYAPLMPKPTPEEEEAAQVKKTNEKPKRIRLER